MLILDNIGVVLEISLFKKSVAFLKGFECVHRSFFTIKIPSDIVIQQIMRVPRRIVLPLPIKALYEFGCFEGILQRTKFAGLLIY